MSQYEITKTRLAQIIKEEYEALSGANALTRTIHRWAEEAKDIPVHLTVARMIENGDLDSAIETLEAMRDVADAPVEEQQKGPVNSIRDMIRQEVKNL